MLSRLRFTLLLPLVALVACATSNPSTNVGGITYTPVAGNYILAVASTTAKSGYFTGNIAISGSAASGVFRFTNPGTVCVSGTQDIPFTGSFANNTLTLTSASFSNSVATLTIQLPLLTNSIGDQVANGTAVIAGGTCALASTTLQATLYPSFAGTWTIALTSPTALTETLTVTQAGPNADGQFPATGSLVYGTTTALTGIVSGPYLNLANTNSTISVSANEVASPITVSITSGTSGGTGTMH